MHQTEGIAFVGVMPKFEAAGGVLTFTIQSGRNGQTFAMPIWLARLANQKVSDILAEHDATKAT